MRSAYAVQDVRAAEQSVLAELPEGALMQRAAAGLARVCVLLLGKVYGSRVLLLVGSGDNGGDALFAGARLADRGARVDALLLGDRAHEAGLAALKRAGGRVIDDVTSPRLSSALQADLVVDGIVGIGGTGALRGKAADVVAGLGDGPIVVAVDVPSGVDADTGEVAGAAVHADVTVTFGALKPGLLVDPGAGHAGAVDLVDIGLGPHLPDAAGRRGAAGRRCARAAAQCRRRPGVGQVPPRRGRGVGRLGPVHRRGRALRGRRRPRWRRDGALRRRRRPDRAWCAAGGPRWSSARAACRPGRSGRAVARAPPRGSRAALEGRRAGARRRRCADRVRRRSLAPGATALLTPHAGELARLLGVERDVVEARRLEHARRAAVELGAVVLLKGSTTVVATPDGRVRVNPTGTAALATAGTGDVLAGLCGALLAGGLDPLDAGSVGAWLHGLAGRLAADGGSPISAYDVLDALPAAFRALGN